jgi:hypothetical protein
MTSVDRINATVDHPAPSRGDVSAWTLWLAALLAPIAFSVQVTASYGIASLACTAGRGPHAALLVINGLALAATAVGGALAWRSWKRLRGEKGADSPIQGEGRTRFIALCTVVENLIVGAAVVFDLVAGLVLVGCPGLPPSP